MNYGLSDVAERMGLGTKDDAVMNYIKEHNLYDKEVVPGKKGVQRNPRFDKVPFEIISKYALRDGELTYKIGVLQEQKVKELNKKYRTINGYTHDFEKLIERECKLTKVLFDIEKHGMMIDREYIERAKKHEEERIKKAKEEFQTLTGFVLIDSAKHLSPILTKRGVTPGRTEKGRESFTDEVLCSTSDEAAKCVREYRDANKRLGTYYSSFTYHGDGEGVVRANIKQCGADTFRFSVTNPALQTLGSEENDEWPVRNSFRAREGYVLLSIDYSQQEYRLSADLAGERRLISQINSGTDIHTATAEMMGVDRTRAKTLNFMLLYGGGSQKLADSLGITLNQAKALKSLYFEKLPRTSELINKAKETADRRGFIFNIAGRALYFPLVKFEKDGIWQQANFSYKAPNYLIQSSGAEIMRMALIDLHEYLSKYKSRVVLSQHDEALIEMHESELYLVPEIQRIMESVYTPRNGLPMKTSVAIGKSWGTLEDVSDITKGINFQEKGIIPPEETLKHSDLYHPATEHSGDAGPAALCER
jgi:DNA polymerase-1